MLIAPTAAHRLVDPVHGELATARAAAAAGTRFVASMASTVDLVDIGHAAPGRCWFQCYLSSRADLEVIVGRAQAGAYSALVLTVDTPVPGRRERDVFSSNHGGRQLDGQPGTLDQLPTVVDAVRCRCASTAGCDAGPTW